MFADKLKILQKLAFHLDTEIEPTLKKKKIYRFSIAHINENVKIMIKVNQKKTRDCRVSATFLRNYNRVKKT